MTASVSILIISPEPQLRDDIQNSLSRNESPAGWTVMVGEDDASVETIIAEQPPHGLVLAAMPETLAWIERYRNRYPGRHTAIMVVTDDNELAQAVLQLDIATIVFYPANQVSMLHMTQCCRHLLTTAQLVRDSALQMRQLLNQVNTDLLTGLHSRSSFDFELKRTVDHCQQGSAQQLFAVLLIDLDDFKEVNATLGHVIGDMLIKEAAERIKYVLSEKDFLARSGGDEFAILIPELQATQVAGHKAQEIVALFEKPFSIKGNEVKISVSVGVVCYPAAGESAADLMSHVDIAMYRAKKDAGNGWQYFTESINKEFYSDLRLESAMRLAIENDELFLLFQPQYDVDSQKIVAAEVLLRWQRPGVGIVNPADFIPLAEASGMIHVMGYWLIERVFKIIVEYGNKGLSCKLGVNVSAKQLEAEDFANQVLAMMERYQVTSKQFSFELTESALMLSSVVENNLFQLASAGIEFAVDDFGTGYSALNYLQRLPINAIKIDRSFVMDLMNNVNDQALVTSLLALAKNLNLTVIAEGVETIDQFYFLHAQGCDIVQGFYFSRPLLLEDFLVLTTQS